VPANWVDHAGRSFGWPANAIEPHKKRFVVGRGHEGCQVAGILEDKTSLDALILVETPIPSGPKLVWCRAAVCAAMVLMTHEFDLIGVDPSRCKMSLKVIMRLAR
jgi:hypothetical protein